MIFFSQILHSICFGAYYVATMKLIYQSAPKGFGERAIGYFSVFGPGLGLMLGRLLAGAAAEYLGEGASLQPLFWLAAVLSAIGAVLALKIRVPAAKREEPEIAHGLSALACDHGECP
jgi:MFS family permease